MYAGDHSHTAKLQLAQPLCCLLSCQTSSSILTSKLIKGALLSTGWGDDIEWAQTYEEGLARSKNSNVFIFLLALRKAFASSPEIQQMAQEDFIMLNLVHSSSDDNMAPDGHYVPRILFVDPSMTVRADLTGKYGNRMYAYEPEDILTCEIVCFRGLDPQIIAS
uniref:Uncharacterized protein n=1 Tax=Accipiter nisus TaxID=211598 RepID=A0A8B9MUS5_9AVES